MTRFVSASAALFLAPILAGACAPTPAARRHPSREVNVNPIIVARFPGAKVLDEAEFARAIVGRVFRYRDVDSEVVVERPKEVFAEAGRYRIHWLRSISYGTYSNVNGTVLIDCTGCRYTFLGLGWNRAFFRYGDRLFMATASGGGNVIELLPEL